MRRLTIARPFKAVTLIVLLFGSAVMAAQVTAFNTGVDNSGNLLPSGNVDPHYTLVVNPDGGGSAPFVVVNNGFPLGCCWFADGPNSQWIAPQPLYFPSSADAVGIFDYQTTFNVTGDPSKTTLLGQWATDNEGIDILINGQSTGNTIPAPNQVGFASFTPFTINGGFVAGTNTLDFIVHNDGGPMGLRVELPPTPPSCPVNPTDVKIRLLGRSLDGKPTGILTSFTPSSGPSLPQLVSQCGFTSFAWVQIINQWPGPSSLFAASNPIAAITIPPQDPIHDPPSGGYSYPASQQPPFLGAFPFYYNPKSIPSGCAIESDGTCSVKITSIDGLTLNFFDDPTNPCLPGSLVPNETCVGNSSLSPPVLPFMAFTTQLVGVCNATPSPLCSEAGKPSTPLFQWTWNDNFNGTLMIDGSGGVFDVQTASSALPAPNSGTGGVVITSLNGVPQTAPSISCTAMPNLLRPANGKQVPVNVSGSVTAGTSAIVASSTAFAVTDSEGQVQPNGSVTIGTNGNYSFTIPLVASRDGTNMNGRQYTIIVTATDGIGNIGSCSAVVTVPHDQGH